MVSTGDRMVNTTHDSQPKGLYILSKETSIKQIYCISRGQRYRAQLGKSAKVTWRK